MIKSSLRCQTLVRRLLKQSLVVPALLVGLSAYADDDFEYHGYLRSGYIENNKGGYGDAFWAPNVPFKYRLGNESETYGEAILVKDFNRGPTCTGPNFKIETLLAYKTFQHNQWSVASDNFTLRECFGEVSNLAFCPNAKIWAGNRFYQRHDIHIIDFYWLDTSGYGGGIQDVPLSDTARFHAAWFGGSPDNAQMLNHVGRINKNTLDLRVTDVVVPLGKGNIALTPSLMKGGTYDDTNGVPQHIDNMGGVGVSVWHSADYTIDQKQNQGCNNTAFLQWGNSVADNFAAALWNVPYDNGLADSKRLRIMDFGVVQPADSFAAGYVIGYEWYNNGLSENNRIDWGTVGARPTYYFNKNFSVALDFGSCYSTAQGQMPDGSDKHGFLNKITLCPQIELDNYFYARPVVRAFVTMAEWSKDFENDIGGPGFFGNTAGMLFGVQVEAWF